MKVSMRFRNLALLILIASLAAASARALTFPVTKTADTADGTCNADCSLREAIIAANANAGPDTITVPAGTYTLTLAGANEDASLTGDLDITDSVTISGAGAATTIIDGGAIDRVLDISGGITVAISGITIRNGHPPSTSPDQGGGIRNASDLTLTNVIVSGNTTADQGGGIYSSGPLSLLNTSVTGNTTTDQGGGIFAAGSFTIIDHSTISGNTNQDQGAGIFNLNGTLLIGNSTISNNTGTDNGGGLYNNPPGQQTSNNVVITASTIADNSSGATQGGGIYNLSPGIVTINGTILANNTGGAAPECAGTITSQGYNLIENPTNCTIVGSTTGNKTGQDPQLLALANNGGPTQTRKLGATSPAIDMWTGCSVVVVAALRAQTAAGGIGDDQRGQPRPAGAACDMGAFECQPMECAGGVAPTATPTATATVVAPTATRTPTIQVSGGAPPTVPTLSFPMLALLGVALAGAALLLMKRS